MKHIAIVILNYNGLAFLQKFLPSVYATTYANWALYVADNASTDKSVDFLQSQGFELHDANEKNQNFENQKAGARKYFVLDKNYGFAGGYNRALAKVEADYYMLLNSDVAVAPDWLEALAAVLDEKPAAAAVQPKILMQAHQHSEVQLFEHAGAAGGWIDKWGYPFCRGRVFDDLEQDKGQHDEEAEIFWATGAAMLVRANLFHTAGGFDADFFAHMEEIDLCWRLKRMGYAIYCAPKSVVWHVGGGTLPKSNPQKTYLNFRNSLAMIVKNVGGAWWLWVVWLRLLLDGVAGLRFALSGQWGNLWAIVRAHWRFFLWLPRLIGRRRLPQNTKSASAFNRAGIYNKSIVYQYFVKNKKRFLDLF